MGFDRLFGSFYSHINFLSFFNLLHFFVLLTGVFWPRKLRSQGHFPVSNAAMRVRVCRIMSSDGFTCLFGNFYCLPNFFSFLLLIAICVFVAGSFWPRKLCR